jgi:hypothetical protein
MRARESEMIDIFPRPISLPSKAAPVRYRWYLALASARPSSLALVVASVAVMTGATAFENCSPRMAIRSFKSEERTARASELPLV